MKNGVITDGISRDFEHALNVMDEFGLQFAELQFVWDKEVGFLENSEVQKVNALLDLHQIKVSNICHHIFAKFDANKMSFSGSQTEFDLQMNLDPGIVEFRFDISDSTQIQ